MREATFRSPTRETPPEREKKLLSGTNARRTYAREDFRRARWWRFGGEGRGRKGRKRSSRVRRGRDLAGLAELFS